MSSNNEKKQFDPRDVGKIVRKLPLAEQTRITQIQKTQKEAEAYKRLDMATRGSLVPDVENGESDAASSNSRSLSDVRNDLFSEMKNALDQPHVIQEKTTIQRPVTKLEQLLSEIEKLTERKRELSEGSAVSERKGFWTRLREGEEFNPDDLNAIQTRIGELRKQKNDLARAHKKADKERAAKLAQFQTWNPYGVIKDEVNDLQNTEELRREQNLENEPRNLGVFSEHTFGGQPAASREQQLGEPFINPRSVIRVRSIEEEANRARERRQRRGKGVAEISGIAYAVYPEEERMLSIREKNAELSRRQKALANLVEKQRKENNGRDFRAFETEDPEALLSAYSESPEFRKTYFDKVRANLINFQSIQGLEERFIGAMWADLGYLLTTVTSPERNVILSDINTLQFYVDHLYPERQRIPHETGESLPRGVSVPDAVEVAMEGDLPTIVHAFEYTTRFGKITNGHLLRQARGFTKQVSEFPEVFSQDANYCAVFPVPNSDILDKAENLQIPSLTIPIPARQFAAFAYQILRSTKIDGTATSLLQEFREVKRRNATL